MAKDDWLARYEARQEQRKQYSERLAEYLIPALRFLGVEAVFIQFDGSGDSGEVQKPSFEGAPAAGVPEGLSELAEHACYYALPGGWEINAGSSGDWTIFVEEGYADLDVEWRDELDEPDEDDEE